MLRTQKMGNALFLTDSTNRQVAVNILAVSAVITMENPVKVIFHSYMLNELASKKCVKRLLLQGFTFKPQTVLVPYLTALTDK